MERKPSNRQYIRKTITLPTNAWKRVEKEAERESARTGASPNISGAIARLILR